MKYIIIVAARQFYTFLEYSVLFFDDFCFFSQLHICLFLYFEYSIQIFNPKWPPVQMPIVKWCSLVGGSLIRGRPKWRVPSFTVKQTTIGLQN